jgi:hypothetical protein
MPEPTTFNFPIDTGRMLRAIDTSDDIGAVIRIHFEIDRALEHIVSVMVPAAQHLRHRFMDERIRFVLALGLPTDRVEPARTINTLRNHFAHREKERLDQSDVDLLEGPVCEMLGRAIPPQFSLRHERKDGSRREWLYGDMSVKEKICMLGFFTLGGIATIENDFQKIAFSTIKGRSSMRLPSTS